MRCNFVDLYYALYGSKRPTAVVGSESSSLSHMPKMPKIPKLSATIERRSASPMIKIDDEEPIRIPTPDIKIEEEVVVDDPIIVPKTEVPEPTPEPVEIKVERDDEPVRPPELKRIKTDFHHSDNSVSLPGIMPGTSGPIGFEPGMFKKEDDAAAAGKPKTEKEKDKDKDKEKGADGQSKVMLRKFANMFVVVHTLNVLLIFSRRKRRRTRKSISTNTNTSTTRIRTRKKIVTRRRKTKKIRIFRDCWSKKIHRRRLVRQTRPATAIIHLWI